MTAWQQQEQQEAEGKQEPDEQNIGSKLDAG